MNRRPRLRERVRFENRTLISDGAGNTGGDWNTDVAVCECWAELNPINGREEVLAQKLTGVQPYEVVIRYSAAALRITTDCRMLWLSSDGAAYDITAIQDPTRRRQWLSILVKKGVASG